jgi:hypothetical protein
VTWLDVSTGATLADVCTRGGQAYVAVASTDGQSVFVAGQFGDTDLFGAPVTQSSRFLARIDRTGVQSQRVFPQDTFIASLAASGDGVIATGGLFTPLTVGSDTLTAKDAASGFLARFVLP